MASLTDNLPNANSAARVIDPQNDKAPSFLQGLANIAEQAVTGGSRLFERNEADNARRAAADAKAQQERVEDATAGLIFDHGLQRGVFAPQRLNPEPQLTPEPTSYVPIDPSLDGPPLPPGVERTVGEVQRSQAAENQGRAPAGSTQIILESAISSLRAQFPDQEHLILDYIKAQGFDHYLFRERDLDKRLADAEVDTVIKGQQAYYDEAIKAGTIPPGTPLEEGALAGRLQAQAVERMRLDKEKREADEAVLRARQQNLENLWKQDDRDAAARGLAFATAGIGPLMTQVNALSLEALQDPNNLKTFEDAIPEFGVQLDNVINQTRMTMAAAGERPEAIEAATAELQRYRQNLIDFTSGPLSQFAQNKRTLENLQTRLGMNIQDALPVYMGLKEVLGQGGLAALFPSGSVGPLPPEVMRELQGELAGIAGAINTDPERLSMRNIASLLRGQTSIDRMSEDNARRVMPTLVAVSNGAAQDYMQGRGSADAFFNSTLQVANAAAGLQPGVTADGARSVVVASTSLFNPTATQAMIKFRTDNPEEGQQLIDSSRSAAVRTHNILKGRQLTPAESMGGLWEIEYRHGAQRGAGTYVMTMTRERYDRWARVQPNRRPTYDGMGRQGERNAFPNNSAPSYESLLADPPAAVKQQTAALNMSLGFLVNTAQFDEDFQGVTPNEVRAFFGRDEVPRAMRQRSEGENAGQSFTERLQGLRTGFQELNAGVVNQRIETTQANNPAPPPRDELQATVKDRAERMGLSWSLVNRLVSRESTWDPNAINTKTQARGLFQINDDRADRSLDENINDGLGMVKTAMERATQVLGRPASDWETYVVHQQGTGGGAALLNPSNASKNALDVLTPAYNGNRRRAEQAIINNGGSTSMTAAQFIRSIKNFFEG